MQRRDRGESTRVRGLVVRVLRQRAEGDPGSRNAHVSQTRLDRHGAVLSLLDAEQNRPDVILQSTFAMIAFTARKLTLQAQIAIQILYYVSLCLKF